VKPLAVLACLAALAPLPASAALSPYYDSAEKIGTILGSGEVADALHQAPLRSIENTGTRTDGADEWTVRTQECDLVVYLIAVPPDGPGMTTYTIDLPKGCD
jgi:hypothetical protein